MKQWSMKQWYYIVWTEKKKEKKNNAKTQGWQRQIKEN